MSIDDNLHVMHIASGDLWAGAEAQLKTLACSLHSEGLCRVSVILLNHGRLEQELRACGVDVTVLDEGRHGGFALLRMMTAAIRSAMPDIVHTHRMKENILGSIAGLMAGRTPSLRTVHGANEHPPGLLSPRRLQFVADRLCGRWLQRAIIAVTPPLADQLEANFPQRRIRVIENGIDTAIEAYPPVDDGGFHIGIVGRLVPVKRVDLFLRCAQLLADRNPQHRLCFHVYGDGPLSDEMLSLRDDLDLGTAVTFHGHSDDIHRAIAGLDVLMITSDHEGLPMTLLEAMLLDTAVVAHEVGGIPRVLDRGSCGVLVGSHDAGAYAAAVQSIIDAPDEAAELRHNARARVHGNYSAIANADATARLYRDILQR